MCATPVGPGSPPEPQKPDHTKRALATPNLDQSSARGQTHEYLGMQFSPREWTMLMKNISQMVGNEIKREDAAWKRTNMQNREMWGGGG